MRARYLVALALAAACGGGTEPTTPPPPPPPPPGPTPVASVAMSRDTATLVPSQTLQLSAEPRAQSGQVLTGRTIAWSSTATAVASVSTDGLVTAATAGSAAVTAVSEGKTGATTVTVRDGAVVAATGGLAATADSLVRITIPGGALAAAQAITIAPIAAPVAHPRLLAGSAFEFGPATVTLAQAATIRIGYAGTTVPVTADPSRFRLHRLVAGAWTEVAGSTVDLPSSAVTGPAAALGSYAILELTPIPVATVTLAPTTDTLVPQQTLQLVATLRDAGGALLGLRPITWTSSALAVATVSSTGLVTAASVGQTTLTAEVEGKSATATITVAAGAVIGAAGGVAATADGKAQVTIPAGALAASQAITITPALNPPASPLLVAGTAFDFEPSGAFAQPVTIRLSYAGSTVPVTATESQLRLHRLTAGVWVEVAGSTVDMVAKTVTGQTSSFSTYAIAGQVPLVEAVITMERNGPTTCSVPGPANCGLQNVGGYLAWVVPEDVFTATVELWGASGGGHLGFGLGQGRGGKTTATIEVVPGEVLQIVPGERGGGTQDTWGSGAGGGHGGWGAQILQAGTYCVTTTSCSYPNGFGGGGGSDIRRGIPPFNGLNRIVVAGGGGGDGGYNVDGGPAPGIQIGGTGIIVPGGAGGHGGGQAGGSGGAGRSSSMQSAPQGGGGGGQSLPGPGGSGANQNNMVIASGDNGYFGGGGGGGSENGSGGGGGGGGWYGGGGGGPAWFDRRGATGAGGGGGSSYGPPGSVFFQGVHVGQGKAILTFTPSPGRLPTVVTVTSSASPVSASQEVTFTATVAPKPPATGTVTGTIRFEVDGVVIGGPVTIVNGQATSPPVSNLTPGPHVVRAVYLGNSTFAPSGANLMQLVVQ